MFSLKRLVIGILVIICSISHVNAMLKTKTAKEPLRITTFTEPIINASNSKELVNVYSEKIQNALKADNRLNSVSQALDEAFSNLESKQFEAVLYGGPEHKFSQDKEDLCILWTIYSYTLPTIIKNNSFEKKGEELISILFETGLSCDPIIRCQLYDRLNINMIIEAILESNEPEVASSTLKPLLLIASLCDGVSRDMARVQGIINPLKKQLPLTEYLSFFSNHDLRFEQSNEAVRSRMRTARAGFLCFSFGAFQIELHNALTKKNNTDAIVIIAALKNALIELRGLLGSDTADQEFQKNFDLDTIRKLAQATENKEIFKILKKEKPFNQL